MICNVCGRTSSDCDCGQRLSARNYNDQIGAKIPNLVELKTISRRDFFAALAMHATTLGNIINRRALSTKEMNLVNRAAVFQADDLIKELDKEESK